jgi:phosphonate transport system substrate-binding protein
MEPLSISTCQSPNSEFFCRDLAGYISNKLGIPVETRLDIPWQQREHLLDAGKIDLCWICGLPYVWKADRPDPQIELLAAPVMRGERYQQRPIYFSDVVVREDSPFETFTDLYGASWAYNEPGSHSGYNVVRYTLAERGKTGRFFSRVIASGAHQTSLQMILNGDVDASAIDSTVLEIELKNNPQIKDQIRIIEILGPSPIPPWVVSKSMAPELRKTLLDLLCGMDKDFAGTSVLEKAAMLGFIPVDDRDYDPIRAMERESLPVIL